MILMGFINTKLYDLIVKVIDFFRIDIGISSLRSLRNLALLISPLPLVMLFLRSFVNERMIGRRKCIMKIVISYFGFYYRFYMSLFSLFKRIYIIHKILRFILNDSCFFTASYKVKSFC